MRGAESHAVRHNGIITLFSPAQAPPHVPPAPPFTVRDPAALHRVIREHPLGMLVMHGDGGLDADHLPFELDAAAGPHGTLTAHVARANPLWQRAAGCEVMVVFRGAQACISPNWYPGKHEAHRQVPSWNYEVVHAHGRLVVQDDERLVRGLVGRLTRRHEAAEPRPARPPPGGSSAPRRGRRPGPPFCSVLFRRVAWRGFCSSSPVCSRWPGPSG